jgi:hypothetical protein
MERVSLREREAKVEEIRPFPEGEGTTEEGH